MNVDDLVADLRVQIEGKNALLVIGAGVSIMATGRDPRASWAGLLRDGARAAEADVSGEDPRWLERIEERLNAGTVEELFPLADEIVAKLGGDGGRPARYRRWLQQSVGSLEASEPEILTRLIALDLPIMTTNYDSLIEDARGDKHNYVTWKNTAQVQRVLRNDDNAIVHLHGHWDDPDNIVLNMASYFRKSDNNPITEIQKSSTLMKSLIFVGMGEGLRDPDLGTLVKWASYISRDSAYTHYRLCRASEVNDLRRQHHYDNIEVVPYGDEYKELPAFLALLEPVRSTFVAEATALVGQPKAVPEDLDREELDVYARSQGVLDGNGLGIQDLLQKLHLIDKEGSLYAWAVLCFANDPSLFFPGATTKIVQGETRDTVSISGPLARQVAESVRSVRQLAEMSHLIGPRRSLFFDAIREAISNAILHRDYMDAQATRIMIFSDNVEVESPGRLPESVDRSAILYARSQPTHPNRARILHYLGAAEGAGLGFASLRECQSEFERDFPGTEVRVSENSGSVTARIQIPKLAFASNGDLAASDDGSSGHPSDTELSVKPLRSSMAHRVGVEGDEDGIDPSCRRIEPSATEESKQPRNVRGAQSMEVSDRVEQRARKEQPSEADVPYAKQPAIVAVNHPAGSSSFDWHSWASTLDKRSRGLGLKDLLVSPIGAKVTDAPEGWVRSHRDMSQRSLDEVLGSKQKGLVIWTGPIKADALLAVVVSGLVDRGKIVIVAGDDEIQENQIRDLATYKSRTMVIYTSEPVRAYYPIAELALEFVIITSHEPKAVPFGMDADFWRFDRLCEEAMLRMLSPLARGELKADPSTAAILGRLIATPADVDSVNGAVNAMSKGSSMVPMLRSVEEQSVWQGIDVPALRNITRFACPRSYFPGLPIDISGGALERSLRDWRGHFQHVSLLVGFGFGLVAFIVGWAVVDLDVISASILSVWLAISTLWGPLGPHDTVEDGDFLDGDFLKALGIFVVFEILATTASLVFLPIPNLVAISVLVVSIVVYALGAKASFNHVVEVNSRVKNGDYYGGVKLAESVLREAAAAGIVEEKPVTQRHIALSGQASRGTGKQYVLTSKVVFDWLNG
jgi:glycerol-3-phosphate cytidylyltransferase-like family protein